MAALRGVGFAVDWDRGGALIDRVAGSRCAQREERGNGVHREERNSAL